MTRSVVSIIAIATILFTQEWRVSRILSNVKKGQRVESLQDTVKSRHGFNPWDIDSTKTSTETTTNSNTHTSRSSTSSEKNGTSQSQSGNTRTDSAQMETTPMQNELVAEKEELEEDISVLNGMKSVKEEHIEESDVGVDEDENEDEDLSPTDKCLKESKPKGKEEWEDFQSRLKICQDEFRHIRKHKLPYRTACWAPDEHLDDFTTLAVSENYNEILKNLPPFEKKIHIVWQDNWGSDVWKYKNIDMVKYGVQNLQDMNPDWEFFSYNLKDMEEYIEKKIAKSDWDMIKGAPLVPKSDIFRLLKIYYEGGFYQDVDRLYNIPFSKILTNDTKLLLPTLYDVTFASDMLGSSRGNPLYKRTIETYLCKLREQAGEGLTEWGILDSSQLHSVATEAMGTYFAAVMETLFGRPIWGPIHHQVDEDEGRAFGDHVRKVISESPYILTHREVWCDLITSKHPNCEGITKKELFDAAKLKQWDGSDNE